MAESGTSFTKSIVKGQIALMCQLCENEPKIKWKCVECDLMMCQRCRDKVHPKFRSADDHTIVDLKSIAGNVANPAKLDFTKLKCKDHNGQACLFCNECNNVVCPSCVASTHKKHDLVEIQDEVQRKIEFINKQKEYCDLKLKDLVKNQDELGDIETKEHSKLKTVQGDISTTERTLAVALRTHSEKLSRQLNDEWNSFNREISAEKTKVTNLLTKVQKEKRDLEEILESKNVVKIFDTTASNLKDIDIPIPAFNNLSTFAPARAPDVSQFFGSLQPRVTSSSITDSQLLDKFETEHDVNKLLVHPDGSIWVSHRIASVLLRLNLKTRKPIRTFKDQYVFDMAFTKKGDLLLSIENYKISVIRQGQENITDCYKSAPLVTSAVHVSSKDQIIFGQMDDGPHFPVGGTRQVRIINLNKQTFNVFQKDRENKPLFTFPYRITSNRENNIAVIDIINSDYDGRIVVLDEDGEVHNIYNGSHLVNKVKFPFKPIDITTVQLDNFLVLDYKSLCLHMLDGKGTLITYCWIGDLSMDALPQSFCVGPDPSHLYIGYAGYDKDKTSKPQVCCVKVPWK